MLADPAAGAELQSAIARLSELVWAPAAAILPAGVQRLLIVPAGPLASLPFVILETKGRPLLEQYTIGYPAARSLATGSGNATGATARRRTVLASTCRAILSAFCGMALEQVANVFRTQTSRLDPDRPLTEMGMDSLMAVELRGGD